MDIKQMKNFVSQELKGLKQEHRLLSVRRFQLEGRAKGGGAAEISLSPGRGDLCPPSTQ